MCGILFNRHSWETLGSTRVCRKCGAVQRYIGGGEFGGQWDNANLGPRLCSKCNGAGQVFKLGSGKAVKSTCPKCGGSGTE